MNGVHLVLVLIPDTLDAVLRAQRHVGAEVPIDGEVRVAFVSGLLAAYFDAVDAHELANEVLTLNTATVRPGFTES